MTVPAGGVPAVRGSVQNSGRGIGSPHDMSRGQISVQNSGRGCGGSHDTSRGQISVQISEEDP